MLDQMELVFDRLKQFNLKIKPKKCQFFNTSVLFLGHVLSANGISANPEKVEKLQKPGLYLKTSRRFNPFLGLASYYRWFINKFAEKAHDAFTSWWVQHLTSKRKKPGLRRILLLDVETGPQIFEWMTKDQDAFDALKEALSTTPALGYPDLSRKFILETDAMLL